MSPVVRPRRWPFVLLAAISLAGGLVCATGYVMAADFTVADAARLSHWRHVAMVYLGLTVLALVLLCVSVVGLWRSRVREAA